MKKILSYLSVSAMLFVLAACSDDDDYTPGPDSTGAFFPAGAVTEMIDIVPGDTQRSITLARSSSQGTMSVNLQVDDPAGLFNIPSEVTFADGQSSIEVPVTFRYEALDFVDYTIQITIPEDQAYLYGTPQKNFTFGIADDYRWLTLDGMGLYTDDYIASVFNGVVSMTWEVVVQQKAGTEGYYRLVNPYADYPYGSYDTSAPHYVEIDANDPEGVYIPLCDIGLDLGYGPIAVWSAAGRYLEAGNALAAIKKAGHCGKLVDGVITFPVKALLTSMDGGLYYGNSNGAFKLVLPGYSE